MTRKLLAVALAAAGLFVAAPAQAAVDADDYYLAPGAKVKIVDDETFGADEVRTFDLSNVYLGRVAGSKDAWFTVSRCAGGEVRVDITVQIRRTNPGFSSAIYYVKLYEGASCSTNDWDGYWMSPWTSVGAVHNVHVDNEDEGGDYADLVLNYKSVPVK